MSDASSSQTDYGLRWFMTCFAIAAVGGFLDVLGWYLFHSRAAAMVGFFVGAGGVVLGGIGIVLRQVKVGADRLNRDK
jgi:hypothetical protein